MVKRLFAGLELPRIRCWPQTVLATILKGRDDDQLGGCSGSRWRFIGKTVDLTDMARLTAEYQGSLEEMRADFR